MMKKILSILLVLAVVLSISGCSVIGEISDKAEDIADGIREIAESETGQKIAETVQGAVDSIQNSGVLDELGDKLRDTFGELMPDQIDNLRNFVLTYKDTDLSALTGTYGHMLDAGFSGAADSGEMLEAGGVSDEIAVKYQEADFDIRLANPGNKAVAYRDCVICCVRISSELVDIVDSLSCGTSTVEDVVKCFGTPYRQTENTLTYKITLPHGFDLSSLSGLFSSLKNIKNVEHHIIFEFRENLLVSITLETPQFLYSGLQENVAPEDLDVLSKMSAAERGQIIKLRDDILEELLEEFREDGIDATLDRDTGKLTLDNSILFARESYALSEEGEAFLRRVSHAYADVMLDDDYEHAVGTILFEGHTDTDGTYEYNVTLSENRANAVMNSFVYGKNGLDEQERAQLAKMVKAEGFSFSDPIFNDDGTVDMAASRRVEIKFYLNLR